MLSDDLPTPQQWNFDEYYAFFHWQPDLIRYRQSLNYLQAKGLIEKALEDNLIVYRITDLGIAALNDIKHTQGGSTSITPELAATLSLHDLECLIIYPTPKMIDTPNASILVETHSVCLKELTRRETQLELTQE